MTTEGRREREREKKMSGAGEKLDIRTAGKLIRLILADDVRERERERSSCREDKEEEGIITAGHAVFSGVRGVGRVMGVGEMLVKILVAEFCVYG